MALGNLGHLVSRVTSNSEALVTLEKLLAQALSTWE